MSERPEPIVAMTFGTGPMQVQLWRDPSRQEIDVVVILSGTIWLQRTIPLAEVERLVEGRKDAAAGS